MLRFPPPLAPVAKACSKKATRSGPTRVLGRVGLLPLRRGAGVQDARALHPGAHGAQAGRQQRLLFQVEPTAGQSVLCGEHKDPQFVGAPHCQGSLPAEAVGVAAQPDPTAPGASRSAALHGVRSLSARTPLGCSLSESGSPGADAVPSPPGARGGEMEGFPRGLRAGEQTESGARTLARRRPRGALWRLPSAAVVGGVGGGRAPRELPALPPGLPPARPRRPRGELITIREGETAAVELGGGGGGGGRGGSNSSSRASRGRVGPAPGQQTQPPPGPRVPRRPEPAAAPGGSTCSRSSSRPADSPRGPVPGLPRRGRRRPPLPGAWPRALAIPPPPPLPGERESKGGSTGRRRAVASGWAQGTRGQGRRGRGARPAEGRPGT